MAAGCSAYRGDRAETPRIRGSDTMLILAQAWAESYARVGSRVAVEVAGGGCGQGIAALVKGPIDIADCSRNIKPDEGAEARTNTGKDRKEFAVGCDALAVYVHRDNPLEEITIDQLAELYRVGGGRKPVQKPGCGTI